MKLTYRFPGCYLEQTDVDDFRKVYDEDGIEFDYEPEERRLEEAAVEYLLPSNTRFKDPSVRTAFYEGAREAIENILDEYGLMDALEEENGFEEFCEGYFEEEARQAFDEEQEDL